MADVALDNADVGAVSAPAAGVSSTSAPAVSSEPGAAPTMPTGTPAAEPEPTGPIPLDRHKAILENTRKELQDKYAWVGERTPEQIQQMEFWWNFADQNPVAFHRWFDAQLRSNPQFAAQIGEGHAPPGRPPDPSGAQPAPLTPDGMLPDGTPVITIAKVQSVVEAAVQQALQPFQQQVMAERIDRTAAQEAQHELADARANWEGFGSLEKRIKQILSTDGRATLHSAYQRAYKEWIPERDRQIRSQTVAELNKKAQATTVSPVGGPPLTPVDRDKLKWEDVLQPRK